MGTADDQRPIADGSTAGGRAQPESRYGSKPSPSGGSNEHLGVYPQAHSRAEPPSPLPGRPELTDLLGRSVLEARTQWVCRAYGLVPRTGGLSRCYLAREAGLEIAADAFGVVTTIFLHFDGEDGFTPYRGEIPGGGGSVPRRAGLWASLGRPDESGEPWHDPLLGDYGPWDRWLPPAYLLHAQYSLDGQNLCRVTYTLPDRAPGESRAA